MLEAMRYLRRERKDVTVPERLRTEHRKAIIHFANTILWTAKQEKFGDNRAGQWSTLDEIEKLTTWIIEQKGAYSIQYKAKQREQVKESRIDERRIVEEEGQFALLATAADEIFDYLVYWEMHVWFPRIAQKSEYGFEIAKTIVSNRLMVKENPWVNYAYLLDISVDR